MARRSYVVEVPASDPISSDTTSDDADSEGTLFVPDSQGQPDSGPRASTPDMEPVSSATMTDRLHRPCAPPLADSTPMIPQETSGASQQETSVSVANNHPHSSEVPNSDPDALDAPLSGVQEAADHLPSTEPHDESYAPSEPSSDSGADGDSTDTGSVRHQDSEPTSDGSDWTPSSDREPSDGSDWTPNSERESSQEL